MWAETPHLRSSSVPGLTELSLPADAWSWTTDVWIIRPLAYQLRQWATIYRVKIGLLNMFLLFKVIWKDYKDTWNKSWQKILLKTALAKLHIKVVFKKQPPEKQPSVIQNNQCLMDKRCFWGLSIFSIQNRWVIFEFVPPCR